MKTFLKTFQDKSILSVFLAEILSLGSIVLFFFLLSQFLQKKAQLLLAGRTPQEIQQLFITSPELAASLSKNLFSLIFWTLGGGLFLLLGTLLLYSFAKAWIWNFLEKKKLTRKTYWRWNVLHIAILLPLFFYALLAIVVRLIIFGAVKITFKNFPEFYLLHKPLIDQLIILFNNFLNFSLLLVGFLFLFLVYHSFVQKYRVWESLGEAFHLLKVKFSLLGKIFLQVLCTAMAFNILIFMVQRFLFPQQNIITGLTLGVLVLLLSWMQVFLVRTLSEDLAKMR